MIPKRIHYVWVGNQPKSELILRCIESWKKNLPDYEIIEWNNGKFEKIKNTYSEQAYLYKKWAFVSDYIRLYALYHEGGIYLDTDVEVTNNLDHFLHLDFFSGYENYHGNYAPITSAVMGSKVNNPIIADLLSYYTTAEFEKKDGIDLEPNTSRISRYFSEKFGLQAPYDGSQITQLNANSIIYPSYYFCTPEKELENYCIHHFNGSWLPFYSRKNKLNIFNKFIISRFHKLTDTNKTISNEIASNEKILFKFPISKKKQFALIVRK
ncbi:glycosyltransferase family 32 protein [Xenorhabdus innexi]|uniref:Exopolysaccharide biosynthesis protein, glycosyltransferase n=1 Tax=Xenorhabdus innexi TaxID=290109 RepID=A0A1N6MZ81_9GAMM|nr:glycosyltransferase [Xenorhabdus innexi]PHM33083.1 exopolysaccharide biosynthesis protein, glycosyltransferase [Xenorhabdus innexi]SIP74183.1 Mannosyltransferase OCH1 related enzyme [Xenorhabdus innexi]